ncbi:MAG TPA: RNase adapter RapZ [Steroidobacteraceae bacterium]|nr:RNase adapter RapZ [Steroidobacteraceae bacterium]
MRLIVISGLSGSGKSVALHMLEDVGFYCIDNIPAAMLKPFIAHTVHSGSAQYARTAVGLDARNEAAEIATVPKLIDELKQSGVQCEVVFLLASDEDLLRRFAETRRKHPMSTQDTSLKEAIAMERRLLEPIIYAADLVVDTSRMGVHDLRELMSKRVEQRSSARLSILLESFGFKNGIPGDADFVFDARSLPNPYWDMSLRALTGRDPEVVKFLEGHQSVRRLLEDIARFVEARIPEHQTSNRRYLTVAIGCTGGQHRSVYLVDKLAQKLAANHTAVTVRHNSLAAGTHGKIQVISAPRS